MAEQKFKTKPRERAASQAVYRALYDLKSRHPDEYRELLEYHKARIGIKKLVDRELVS